MSESTVLAPTVAPSQRHLKILVFTSGMTVMAVEMTGLRLLAPYFGTSLIVTTILIGSLMGFLSLGYSLGGKRGDKHPTLRALSKVTAVAAVMVLVIPLIGRPILKAAAAMLRPLVQGEQLDEPTVAIVSIVGGVLGIIALFAVPITLMGMVSPWAVRLAVRDVDDAGKVAGSLYALSTVGSILGTLLPAFLLVPQFGVRNTFFLLGGLFLAVSAWGLLRPGGAAALGAAALALMLLPEGLARPMDGLVYEGESNYHFIQVVREPYGRCKDANHLYLNEGVGVHSVKCNDEDAETRGVWTYMATSPLWLDDPNSVDDVLIIGLAGGTIARQLLNAFPQAHIDGVEIDGKVVDVGIEYFDNGHPNIRPIVMDGRIFLQATTKKYDVVMMDAYRQPYIPFHLVTVEFFEEVRAHMSDDAVLAVNVASVRGVSRTLAAMIYRTMREVFPSVHLVDATTSNDVLFATTKEKSATHAAEMYAKIPRSKSLDQARKVYKRKSLGEVEGWQDAQLLTDDHAPVELAWDMMALDYAK